MLLTPERHKELGNGSPNRYNRTPAGDTCASLQCKIIVELRGGSPDMTSS